MAPELDLDDPVVQAMLDVRPGPGRGGGAGGSEGLTGKGRGGGPAAGEDEDEEDDNGAGLIDLDMKQFASGTMQDPLRHAVGLRSAQDEVKMRLWKSWPSLFQNTIFHGEQDPEIASLRRGGSAEARLARAEALKAEGNALLKAGDPQAATERYEKSAGVLRFVECVRPDWKNDDGSYKGIEDQWLRVDESAIEGGTEEAAACRRLLVSCYLNIALAAQRQGKWDEMYAAANEVLEKVDPGSAKALFRRAQARAGPAGAQDADQDAAIEDLAAAARLEPQDRGIRDLLSNMRAERKAQRRADREKFAGLFDRGEVCGSDFQTGGSVGSSLDPSTLDLRDPRVQRMLDVRPGPADAAGPAEVRNTAKAADEGAEEVEEEKGAGLIDLDMKQFASGTLQDPLRHAVGLRSAQDDKKMRLWKSLPTFFQNTIFHGEQDPEIKALRHGGDMQARLARAGGFKEEGNRLLRDGDVQAAIEKYERGAGVLRFVECTRKDWKNDDGSYKGIEDEWLRLDSGAVEGEGEEAAAARGLVASCYLNVALAAQKQEKWDLMYAAATEVFDKVDASSAKALFRRAQARVGPAAAQDADRDAAIEDLAAAARLAPLDKGVRELLAKMRADRRAQQRADRDQFSGLFDRGRVVTNDPRTEGEKLDPSKLDLRDPKVQRMLDVYPGPNAFEGTS